MMKMNSAKWKVLRITNRRTPVMFTHLVNSQPFQAVPLVQYLGVELPDTPVIDLWFVWLKVYVIARLHDKYSAKRFTRH